MRSIRSSDEHVICDVILEDRLESSTKHRKQLNLETSAWFSTILSLLYESYMWCRIQLLHDEAKKEKILKYLKDEVISGRGKFMWSFQCLAI